MTPNNFMPNNSPERSNVGKEAFEKLKQEWLALDNKYDGLIETFFNNPRVLTPEELADLKEMQRRLFELEVEALKVASGENTIEG